MKIRSLELQNFRNYDKMKIEFSDGINIFYGDNAQGKTNLLEAIYVCSTTKSQRGSKDAEMINFSSEEAHIGMEIDKNSVFHKIDMLMKKNKRKSAAIDGIVISKATELYGNVNIISFSPDDLGIIKNGPSERRRFVDMELCQLDKVYLHNLINYNRTLNQRNTLLKQLSLKSENMDTLSIWDEQLITYGNLIIDARRKFINELKELVRVIHFDISGGLEELDIEYLADVEEDMFMKKLISSREKDILFGTTGIGPHRDDIIFSINNNNVRKFGSQGQQRSSALSLKLAEIEFVRKKINDTPILLLDDVLSELDRSRQTQLLNRINNIQTVITCTGLEEFVNNRIDYDRLYTVKNGTIIMK